MQCSSNTTRQDTSLQNDSMISSPTAQTREPPGMLRNQPIATTFTQFLYAKNPIEKLSRRTKFSTPPTSIPDPLFVELLSNFLISEGIPLEVSRDSTFQDLIRHFNPKCNIPTENSMTEYVEKHYVKPLINYPKTIGPISLTIDIYDDLDEKFLVFSIHYFEDIYERENAVYLKKISDNRIDAINTLNTIRRAVNNYSFRDVMFSYLVGSNQEILRMNGSRDLVNQFHTCFYRNMSNFVTNLLRIDIFSHGLDVLRRFIRLIKGSPDLYRMFENFQSARNQETNLPSMDNDSWESTYIFLTKCLLLHESFIDFCEQYKIRLYMTDMVFNHLIHLQRLLRQCVYYCRSLSTPSSSISQIIPAIEGLRRLIDREFLFQQEKVQELLDLSFGNYSGNSYEVAVLLDPLFSYTDIFPEEKWKYLENLVIEEFVNTDWKWTVHSGILDATMMNSRERITFISSEITIYRQFSMRERPEESDCPFLWWAERQSQFEFLSVMAREYFSCPAVSIDASFYFSDGGKLHRLSKMYSGQQLEQSLNLAASHQEFRGKGASEDDITYSMIEKLDGLTRKPKTPYFQTIRKVVSNKPEPHIFVPTLLPSSIEESDVKLESFNPLEPHFDTTTATTKHKSKPRTRSHCSICNDSKASELLWYFKRRIERLILVLGCLSRGFFTVMCAEEMMRKYMFYVCSCHIWETIEEIYEKLELKAPKDLYSCSMELFENMFNSVAHLNPGMTKDEFQEALFEFFIKYENVREENETRPQLSWNKVAKVKEEPSRVPEDDEDEVDPLNPELTNSYDLSTPRNRRCTICRLLRGPGDIKSFRRECDRLLIIIGCLVGESINVRQAEALMRKTNIYVCNNHIEETHREIYKKLCSAESDLGGEPVKIQKMMDTVTLLMPELELSTLQRMLNEFLNKYNYLMSEEQKYVSKPQESEEKGQENESLDEGEESDYDPDDSDYSPDSTWPMKNLPEESTSSAKKSRKRKDSDENWEPSKKKQMMTRYERSQYIDYLANLNSVICEYIPKQLLKKYHNMGLFGYRGALDFIRIIMNNSNNNIRMYGTAEELESDLRRYWDLYPHHLRFDLKWIETGRMIPTKFRNLKGELFYCKQELFLHFQVATYTAFRDTSKPIPEEFKEYLNKHKARLFGCYEFVKYDQTIFDELKNTFFHSENLNDFVYSPDEITILPRRCVLVPAPPDVNTFEKLIKDYPDVFLSNCDVKGAKLTAVVRIFEDDDFNNDQKTRNLEEVFTTYRDFIQGIEFIRCPIHRTKHAAVPIATPTGGRCILVADFLMETVRLLIFGLNIFQKLKKNTWHLMEEFVDTLEKIIPAELDGTSFIDLNIVNEFRRETDEYWKDFEENPEVVEVREVGENGFTSKDLEDELKYLGLTDVFPNILHFAKGIVPSMVAEKNGLGLKTSDMFDALETCQIGSFFYCFPKILDIIKTQSLCSTNTCLASVPTMKTSRCIQMKKEDVTAKIEEKCAVAGLQNIEDSSVEQKVSVKGTPDSEKKIIRSKSSKTEIKQQFSKLVSPDKPSISEEHQVPENKQPTIKNCEKCYRTSQWCKTAQDAQKAAEKRAEEYEKKAKRTEELEGIVKKMKKEMKELRERDQKINEENEKMKKEMEKLREKVKKLEEDNERFRRQLAEEKHKNETLDVGMKQLKSIMNADRLESALRQNHLEEDLGRRDRTILELRERLASQLKMIPINSTVSNDVTDTLGQFISISNCNNWREMLSELQKLKNTFPTADLMAETKNMIDRFVAHTNLPESKQLAEYEIFQLSASIRIYLETLDINIMKIEKTNDCSDLLPLPPYPRLSTKFLNQYCEQVDNQLEMPSDSGFHRRLADTGLDTNTHCYICFEEFEGKLYVCKGCKKKTHEKCCSKWLLHEKSCPYCREKMLPPKIGSK
ncbi:hypothetical protein GCK72_010995 [Caenorhabditis remanei]|uniref:RING-type domain-containing protein n=1 Tax=Caenorhabditis remanei TaxID=31234 RepID=A0A6A5H897_CAERE|nr:hypothetical protein GCK72_010995 [Caenorhabditis remanei]KAF1762733.1 hypothetical protein GCK72_010995 [Caenorhabditis remanei]